MQRTFSNFTSRAFGLAAAACIAVTALAASGQPPVGITGTVPGSVKHGGKLVANVKFVVSKGFHIYSPTFTGVGVPVKFELKGAPAGFKLLAPKAPKGQLEGTVTMQVPIAIAAAAKGKQSLTLVVSYQQCNDKVCYPQTQATVSLNTVVK